MKRFVWIWLAVLTLAVIGLVTWEYRQSHQTPSPPRPPSPSPTPTAKVAVTLYFANRAYIETGDETLPHLLAERRLLDLADTNRAAAAVRALQAGPRSAKAAGVVPKGLQILDVRVDQGIAYLNLARANLSGGSLQEALLIQGTVKTLTGLPGIRAVQFLVQGEQVETLMGHLAVNEPLTAEDVR